MIIENHALWGEEPTEDYPATFTYLGAEPLPDKPNGRRPAVIICGGGGFTHIAPHEQDPVAFAFWQPRLPGLCAQLCDERHGRRELSAPAGGPRQDGRYRARQTPTSGMSIPSACAS